MVVASAGAILLLIFLLLLILFLIFIFILLFLSVFSWRSWRLGGSSSSCHLAGMDGDAGVYRPRTRRCARGIWPGLEHLFGPDGLRLDEWLAAGQASIVKHGPHRTVYHVVLPGLDFYLKHNRLADCRAKLRELVRPSKARSEYEHAQAVAARQVPTFEPLALGEPCRAWAARDSFLITRTLPETQPLHTFLETTLPQWPAPRRTRL